MTTAVTPTGIFPTGPFSPAINTDSTAFEKILDLKGSISNK
jgi:hypothetical protein